jgi:glycosyltransferase involved in cell wall biosynthesis
MTARPLRVLVVGHTYMVGVNQAKLHTLANSGEVELGLLVPSRWQSSEWQRRFLLDSPYSSFRIYASPVWFGRRGGAYLYPPWHLYCSFRNFQPDLIHVHQEVFSLSAFQVALLAYFTRKKLVVECAEDTVRRLSAFRKITRNFVLRTANAIVTCSHNAVKLLRGWGFSKEVEIIPHLGVDTTLFSPSRRKGGGDFFTVGFVGRLVHEKGIDLILSASRTLRERGYKCRIIICGIGPHERTLRREAQLHSVLDMVTWTGSVRPHEVPELMSKFDVLVLPSRTVPTWKEQFGHVLIEAMAMGIPVIGSTSGEIPNVIGRRDVVFPEDDPNGLANILDRMVKDSAWLGELRQYGIKRVIENYTHERIAERLIGVWFKIINPHVYRDSR